MKCDPRLGMRWTTRWQQDIAIGLLVFLCCFPACAAEAEDEATCSASGPDGSCEGAKDGDLSISEDQYCSTSAKNPKFARLCGWLASECGAKGLENVYLGEFDHAGQKVRGLGMRRALPKGSEVFCVPQQCWLVRGTEDAWVKSLTMGASQCGATEKLSIHLAEEKRKGNESFWAPYLDWLPTREDFQQFHPAYLGQSVKLPTAMSYWESWAKSLKACHAFYSMRSRDKGRSAASWEDVYEAYVLLTTRTFEEVDMVPLADSANTEPESKLTVAQTYHTIAKDSMCLNARRDLAVGDELMCDYGGESHSAMLMFSTYGFAFDGEHHDPTAHGNVQQDGEERAIDICKLWDRAGIPKELPKDKGGLVLERYHSFIAKHCKQKER